MIPSLIVSVVPEEFVIPPALLPVKVNAPPLIVVAFITVLPWMLIVARGPPAPVMLPKITSSAILNAPVLLARIPLMLILSEFEESPKVTFP